MLTLWSPCVGLINAYGLRFVLRHSTRTVLHCKLLCSRGDVEGQESGGDNNGEAGGELYEFYDERQHPALPLNIPVISVIVHTQ